jgi:hypothetical protein
MSNKIAVVSLDLRAYLRALRAEEGSGVGEIRASRGRWATSVMLHQRDLEHSEIDQPECARIYLIGFSIFD